MKTQSACTYWANFGSMLGCRIQVGVGKTMLNLRWANTVSIVLVRILRGVGLQTLARRWTNCIFSHRFGFKSCYWANIGPLLQTLRCIVWLFKICWHANCKAYGMPTIHFLILIFSYVKRLLLLGQCRSDIITLFHE